MIKIVTGASRTHRASIRSLLYSLRYFGYDTILFDLGLDTIDATYLQSEFFDKTVSWQFVDYRRALTSAGIDITRSAGNYQWKSMVVKEALNRLHPGVRFLIWLDSGNIVTQTLDDLLRRIEEFGVYTPASSGKIKD